MLLAFEWPIIYIVPDYLFLLKIDRVSCKGKNLKSQNHDEILAHVIFGVFLGGGYKPVTDFIFNVDTTVANIKEPQQVHKMCYVPSALMFTIRYSWLVCVFQLLLIFYYGGATESFSLWLENTVIVKLHDSV